MRAKNAAASRSSRSGASPRPAAPRAPVARVDPQQQRAVGLEAAGGELVDRAHRLDAEPAPAALVGERGVDEAVEQHPLAAVEQRRQRLLDELGARGGVEQRLGARADAQRRVLAPASRMRSDSSTPPGSRSTRTARPRAASAAREARDQRRLARAVEPLDRDQPPARHRPRRIYDGHRWHRRSPAPSPPARRRRARRRAAAAGRPRTPTCCTARPARASARRRARSPPRCSREGRRRPGRRVARARRARLAPRPHLGRAERRARDAAPRRRRGRSSRAAARTPFEARAACSCSSAPTR